MRVSIFLVIFLSSCFSNAEKLAFPHKEESENFYYTKKNSFHRAVKVFSEKENLRSIKVMSNGMIRLNGSKISERNDELYSLLEGIQSRNVRFFPDGISFAFSTTYSPNETMYNIGFFYAYSKKPLLPFCDNADLKSDKGGCVFYLYDNWYQQYNWVNRNVLRNK